jgi:hypothetical protein
LSTIGRRRAPGRGVIRALHLLPWLLVPATPTLAAADLLLHPPLPLTTPTYEGSGQAVHPDVLWMPKSWHGYTHWMAVTPYPCGSETAENPTVLASHDGLTWEVPSAGGVSAPAPLVGNHEPCRGYARYNNDPCIVLVGDTLSVYYLVTWRSGPLSGSTQMRRVASTDGVHWTPPERAPVMWTMPNYALSPSVVHDGTGWRMWYVRTESCESGFTEVRERTSVDGIDWPSSTDHSVRVHGNQALPFHLAARRFEGVYIMLYVGFPAGAECGKANTLYYAESADGEDWVALENPVLSPSNRSGEWDARSIYRASFVGRYPNIGMWYSAFGDATCPSCPGYRPGPVWRVGFTSIGDYRHPTLTAEAVNTASGIGATIPNPTTSACTIEFDLAEPAELRLEVFDLLGRRLATLAAGRYPGGRHTVRWKPVHDDGTAVPSGVYTLRLVGDGFPVRSSRLVVVR